MKAKKWGRAGLVGRRSLWEGEKKVRVVVVVGSGSLPCVSWSCPSVWAQHRRPSDGTNSFPPQLNVNWFLVSFAAAQHQTNSLCSSDWNSIVFYVCFSLVFLFCFSVWNPPVLRHTIEVDWRRACRMRSQPPARCNDDNNKLNVVFGWKFLAAVAFSGTRSRRLDQVLNFSRPGRDSLTIAPRIHISRFVFSRSRSLSFRLRQNRREKQRGKGNKIFGSSSSSSCAPKRTVTWQATSRRLRVDLAVGVVVVVGGVWFRQWNCPFVRVCCSSTFCPAYSTDNVSRVVDGRRRSPRRLAGLDRDLFGHFVADRRWWDSRRHAHRYVVLPSFIIII